MKASRDGHQPKCKPCSAKYDQENAERIAARKRKYAKANTDKIAARKREYYKANAERILEQKREYSKANKDKIAAKDREYYKANTEKLLERAREYRKDNAEKLAEWRREWSKANPDKILARNRNQRARKRNADGHHTSADACTIFNNQRGLCANCHTKLLKSGAKKYHIDHIQPLSKGGSNDKYNLQCLCQACNLRKNAKDPISWAVENGRLL